MKNLIRTAAALALLAAAALHFTGCESSSPNSVERNVGVDYTGFYAGQNSGNIPVKNSGTPITFMNVRQTGSKLEAVDNTGFVWNGSIGNNPSAENLQATFTLKGRTTVGNDVTISGNLNKDSAGATVAHMTGTWIEPTFYSVVRAIGTVSATVSNSPPPSTNTNTVLNIQGINPLTPLQRAALHLHTTAFVFHRQT